MSLRVWDIIPLSISESAMTVSILYSLNTTLYLDGHICCVSYTGLEFGASNDLPT